MSDQKIEEMRKQIEDRIEEEKKDLPPEKDSACGNSDSNGPDIHFVRKCYNAFELGDSLLFNYLHRGQFVCNEVSGEWLAFVGPHWELDYLNKKTKAAIENVVELYINLLLAPIEEKLDNLDEKDDKSEISALRADRKKLLGRIEFLRTDRGRNSMLRCSVSNSSPLTVNHVEMDKNPWLFPCCNGVYNLKINKFKPGGDPYDYLTFSTPVKWESKDIGCPHWKNFLFEILGNNQELVDYLQRILGYAITGLRSEHIFVVLHGPHGRNGKGTLINVLRQILGVMVSKINTEMLMSQRFSKSSSGPSPDVMDMKGKRIIWASETEKGQSFAHGKVKEFSGGEPLKGRGLNDKYMTEFDPTHVLFLLCNDRPKAPPQDKAFWSRIRVITFPYSFESICTEPHQRPVDKNIEQKLLEEAPGILNWLFEGNEMWQRDGESPPEKVLIDSLKYREHVDDLQEWLDTQCMVDKTDASTENREQSTLLYGNYRNYWERMNTSRAMNQTEFSDQLQAKGFTKIKSGKIYYQFVRLMLTDETNI